MANVLVDVGGIVVAPESLSLVRARETAQLLSRGGLEYARLIECRRRDEGKEELVILEVDIQVPQKRAHDIQGTETIAIVYFADDRRPDVLSLRRNFPSVPHLNLSHSEYPKSLCLYEQDWSELKSRWTPTRLIERIRFWFAQTARAALHQDDQPLEPLIVGSGYQIIVPHDLFDASKMDDILHLNVSVLGDKDSRVLRAVRQAKPAQAGIRFISIAVTTEVQTHGVIRKSPSNLYELDQFLSAAGCSLLGKLRSTAKLWGSEQNLKSRLIVIVACPKRRGDSATVEATDVWTFLTLKTVEEVLVAIGRREMGGYLMGEPTAGQQGQSIELEVLRTSFSYSRDLAALLNGRNTGEAKTKFVAVGLGALGSKLQLSLARAGIGQWTLVDDDVLLPHNLARYQYGGSGVGFRKCEIAAYETQSLFDSEAEPATIPVNVLSPRAKQEQLLKAFAETDVILDMSASVTVARYLASVKSDARRVSVFFNPSGTDLVVLAEDKDRKIPLDSLEFQLYRGLLTQPELENHLAATENRFRYAASCRDITSRVPDDQISLLAAVGSRAVKDALTDPKAQIKLWKLDPVTFNVTSFNVPVARVVSSPLSEWTMVIDDALLKKLKILRKKKLPNETGGVLLGFFNHETKHVYIIDTIPSPPDSKEWPTLYIRGSEMLATEIDRVVTVTGGNVEYIGEWHSHPQGCSCRPSQDDVKVFAWLTLHMSNEGLPALMAIVGDEGPHFFLGQMIWEDK